MGIQSLKQEVIGKSVCLGSEAMWVITLDPQSLAGPDNWLVLVITHIITHVSTQQSRVTTVSL